MELGCLVMATRGENIEGFLALLNEVMWEALVTLSEPPFEHFPKRTEMNGVFKFSMQNPPDTLYEKRMTELVMCQAHMIRCLEA